MSSCIILWELPDRLICGDEDGRLVVIKSQSGKDREPVVSKHLKCIRCPSASLEFLLQVPGYGTLSVPMNNAFIDGFIVRCSWVPQVQTWIIAGEPKPLPSAHN